MIHSLKVFKVEYEVYTSPQKCFLPRECIPNGDFFPGCLAKIKFASQESLVICRIFSMNNIKTKGYCELDPSVQWYINGNVLNPVRIKNVNQLDDKIINVQLLGRDENIFEVVEVEVVVLKFKIDFMSDANKFEQLVKDILKNYKFTVNCVITTKDHLLFFEHGIDKIIIKSTDQKAFGSVHNFTKIRILKTHFNSNSNGYKNLGGVDDVRSQLEAIIQLNQKRINTRTFVNQVTNQILITGPSGVGKSSLIHNLCIAKSLNLFEIRCTDIIRSYPGETEAELRRCFQSAFDFAKSQQEHLAVLLVEDVDQFCPRDIKINDQMNVGRIATQMINLLDRVNSFDGGILVIATTSNIENLDLKLRRPGRLELEIFISLPTCAQRLDILKVNLDAIFPNPERNTNLNIDEIASEISVKTPGYVGADISLLVQNVSRQILKNNLRVTEIQTDHMINFLNEALKVIRPSCLRENIDILNIEVSAFNHIGGVAQLKRALEMSVIIPLQHPESYQRFSLGLPKGILFYGPPGCAKTTMAKYLAARTNMTFIAVSGAEIYSPYVGDAEKFIVKIFNKARMSSPAIIFLDEIDALVGNRAKMGKTNDVQTRVLSTLLNEMDGIGLRVDNSSMNAATNTILVVAATNRPDMIDDALMRPGRFDKLIHVTAPDAKSRLEILQKITQKMPIDDDVNFDSLAEACCNFSGADLFNLCNEAALHSLTQDINTNNIKQSDFDYAMRSIKPSLIESQIQFYNEFEKQHRNVI